MAGAPETRPTARITQEMRFAVVMYGGTSLAIYINGVAQELLALVRATASEEQQTGEKLALIPTEKLRGTERVYRKLGQLVGWGQIGEKELPDEAPIRTRFVVDILSGTSAGGLNAIYLGKALANEQDITQLKALWRDEADMDLLVNDNESTTGTELKVDSQQSSLLNSKRMYWQLLSALDGMDRERPARERSRLVDELDCWITTTDIRGLLLPLDLYDRFVFERRHRKVFHFIYRPSDGLPERNDFARPLNPFLAFAGRSTSAFPFAFEPMQLADMDSVLQSERFRDVYAANTSRSGTWRRFFEEYLKTGEPETLADAADAQRVEAYRTTSFGDGGYLDNKPFTYATDALGLRRAAVPVDRRLIYVEPHPNDRPPVGKAVPTWKDQGPLADVIGASSERPNALANVQAALLVLPRVETIREDLQRLLDRNRDLVRLSDIARSVDIAVRDQYAPEPMPEPDRWRALSAREWMEIRGVQYAAYYRLHVASALDDLATTVTRAAGFDENSDEESAIRCFVQAWAGRRYPETGAGEQSQNELLFRFSLDYRLRRIRFLQRRIDELLRFDDSAASRFLDAGATPELLADWSWSGLVADELYKLKATLDRTLTELRAARGRLWSRGENPLYEDLRELPIGRDHFRQILNGATSREESVQRARDLLDDTLSEAFDKVAEKVAETYAGAFDQARESVSQALDAGEARKKGSKKPDPVAVAFRVIRQDFERYDVYDSIIFPVEYGHLDEMNRVEVIRVSPADAPSIVDESAGKRRKLAGTGVHHFGGFLDARWRRNDMLWGRLDAAERIIETVLFGRSEEVRALRADLLKEAQLAIIEEEFEAADESELTGQLVEMALATRPGEKPEQSDEDARARLAGVVARLRTPEEILAFMKRPDGYEVNRQLELDKQLRTAGRAAVVTGRVLDGISENPRVRLVTKWLARVGRLGVGLVELASPKFPWKTGRYWFFVLLALGLAMVALGLLFGNDGATHVGWILVLVLAGLVVTTWILRDVFDRRRRELAAEPRVEPREPPPSKRKQLFSSVAAGVGALAIVAVVALAAVEVFLHLPGDLKRLFPWW